MRTAVLGQAQDLPNAVGLAGTYRRRRRQGTKRKALSPGWDLSASGSEALQPGSVWFSTARGCRIIL